VISDAVKFDDKGDMYIFTRDGIFKAEKKASGFGEPELVAEVKDGYTTAGDFDSEGNIYFCDAIFVPPQYDGPTDLISV